MSDQERLAELGRFLKDRRARTTPKDRGLPTTTRRRVKGLRREEVASLAGIGVSWYTALENGDVQGVSDGTLLAIADALQMSASERQYLLALAGRPEVERQAVAVDSIVVDAMKAHLFPAYIITSVWDVLCCNEVFCRVWGIRKGEVPFNAVERLFLGGVARTMHGAHFADNIAPVIGMLRSSQGRRPDSARLREVCERLAADHLTGKIWDAYDIRSPRLPNRCTIESPIGTFTYETLTLPISGAQHALVIQVPDAESRQRLITAP
jgi:transcriptional regulator with XRE-family HTH domain